MVALETLKKPFVDRIEKKVQGIATKTDNNGC